MTPDHAAFLRAICASPHDDLPRLVYADFLEETEHPESVARAHFIRAQIAMSQFPPGSIEHDTAAGVAARCLDMFGENWAWDYPKWFQTECKFEYRRGFPEVVSIPFDVLFDGWISFCEMIPVVDMRISPRGLPQGGAFLGVALNLVFPLKHVTTLRLGPNLPFNPAFVMEYSELGCGLSDEVMACQLLTNVHTLDLSQNQFTNDWAVRFTSALPSAAFAHSLRELDLSMNFHLTDAAANVFATTPAFDGLTRLRLKDTQITRSGAAMLRRRFGNRVEV